MEDRKETPIHREKKNSNAELVLIKYQASKDCNRDHAGVKIKKVGHCRHKEILKIRRQLSDLSSVFLHSDKEIKKKLEKVFISFEEDTYMYVKLAKDYQERKEEALGKLEHICVSHFFLHCNSSDYLKLRKTLKSVASEVTHFYDVLFLVKNYKYEEVVKHPWVHSFFHKIKKLCYNKRMKNIRKVESRISKYINGKREQLMRKHVSDSFSFIFHLFMFQLKIVLCIHTFLNVFVQSIYISSKLTSLSAKDIVEEYKEKYFSYYAYDNFTKLVHLVFGLKNHSFHDSCISYLQREEEVYHKCEFLAPLCISIFLLCQINNFQKKSRKAFFESPEYGLFKKSMTQSSSFFNRKESNGCFFWNLEIPSTEHRKEDEYIPLAFQMYPCLYFMKTRYLWTARIAFLWHRIFPMGYHDALLKNVILFKPLCVFKRLKLVSKKCRLYNFEGGRLRGYGFDLIEKDVKPWKKSFVKQFYKGKQYSASFEINVLSNFAMYCGSFLCENAFSEVYEKVQRMLELECKYIGRPGKKRMYQTHLADIMFCQIRKRNKRDQIKIIKDIDPLSKYDVLSSNFSEKKYQIENAKLEEWLKRNAEEEQETDYEKRKKEDKKENVNKKNCVQPNGTKKYPKKMKHLEAIPENTKKLKRIHSDIQSISKTLHLYQKYKQNIINTFLMSPENKSKENAEVCVPCEQSTGVQVESTNVKIEILNKEQVNGYEENNNTDVLNPFKKVWKLVDVDPDTDILEEPAFADEDENTFIVLNYNDQLILLQLLYSQIRFSAYKDLASYEQVIALTSRCLKCYEIATTLPETMSPENTECVQLQNRYQNNLIHSFLLWVKSNFCYFSNRGYERAGAQLLALLEESYYIEFYHVDRFKFVYDLYIPPSWELKKSVAVSLKHVGRFMTSVTIYKELELWEDAVDLLIQVKRNGEAQQLLDEQLEKKRTPGLLCLCARLDFTNALTYFKEAWELSKNSYIPAVRGIAECLLKKGEYEEGAEYLLKAVQKAPLSVTLWRLLGMCKVYVNEYDKAIDYFTRCVKLVPSFDVVWYNLAHIYSSQYNDFTKAKICMSHALKQNYDDYDYWFVYLRITLYGMDIDEFLRAYKRLYTLNRERKIYAEFFTALDHYITENVQLNEEGKRMNVYVPKIYDAFNETIGTYHDVPEFINVFNRVQRLYKEEKREEALETSNMENPNKNGC